MTDGAEPVPRSLRRGPLITLTCECGERRQLHYGERWTCEGCGRGWSTSRIPADQYAALRATQLRYRRVPLAISAVALICVIAFVIVGKALGGLLLIAVVTTTWNIFFRAAHKRRYRQALAELPTWQIKPD